MFGMELNSFTLLVHLGLRTRESWTNLGLKQCVRNHLDLHPRGVVYCLISQDENNTSPNIISLSHFFPDVRFVFKCPQANIECMTARVLYWYVIDNQ